MAEDAIEMKLLAAQAKASQRDERDTGRVEIDNNDSDRFEFDFDSIDLGF